MFAAGASLAGLAGALVAPLTSIESRMGDPLLIMAFVVVVIGGLGSVKGAFIAALIIGIADTVGRTMLPALLRSLFNAELAIAVGPGIASMLVYIVMAAIFIIGQSVVPSSGTRMNTLTSLSPGRFIAIPIFICVAFLPLLCKKAGDTYSLLLGTRAIAIALAALSVAFILNVGGMASFGHAAYVGIGAYAAAIPTNTVRRRLRAPRGCVGCVRSFRVGCGCGVSSYPQASSSS